MSRKVILVEQIPNLTRLYRENRIQPLSEPESDEAPNQPFNDRVCLIEGDITKLQVDAIVNAAKNSLLGGGGVDGAIHRAAGPSLKKECRTLGGCDTGSAKITKAYNLPSENVIHTVGPVYRTRGPEQSKSLLQDCYRNCLKVAVDHNCRSIAFCCISTGAYGYPHKEAAAVAVSEIRSFLEAEKKQTTLEKVIFCCHTGNVTDLNAYSKSLSGWFPPVKLSD